MPASELYLWVAYDRISPIGDERQDIHAAQISSAIYQAQGAKVTIQDTIIKWKQEEKDPIQESHQFFKSIQKAIKDGR